MRKYFRFWGRSRFYLQSIFFSFTNIIFIKLSCHRCAAIENWEFAFSKQLITMSRIKHIIPISRLLVQIDSSSYGMQHLFVIVFFLFDLLQFLIIITHGLDHRHHHPAETLIKTLAQSTESIGPLRRLFSHAYIPQTKSVQHSILNNAIIGMSHSPPFFRSESIHLSRGISTSPFLAAQKTNKTPPPQDEGIVSAEEEFSAITDKIPKRPVTIVEGTSYTLIIIAALGVR